MSGKETKKQVSAIKGTKDILPRDVRKWQRVEAEIKAMCEGYGYQEIRTPVFEATELFQKSTGESSDIVMKEMYSFVDKGGRSLTLRPEYTPSIVRAIIEHRLYLQPQPMRYYYIGPMFRYDKPQKGRYRQFHQLDIEVFGEKDAALDAEIVEMASSLLFRLKVKETLVLINSVGCRKCRPDYHKELKQQAEKAHDSLCSDCQRKISTNPLRIFDCKEKSCREISQKFPKITDFLCGECEQHFKNFCSYLELYGLVYKIEPRLVRGLDYYTKTTFEIVSTELGAQDAILGGGRYDDMIKDFGGPDVCGIGFALGMERLLSLIPNEKEPENIVYLICLGEEAKKEAMLLAQYFHRENIECLLEYKDRSLSKLMSRANKIGAAWVLIVGEEEIKKKRFQIKNMATGEQNEVTQEEALNIIRGNI